MMMNAFSNALYQQSSPVDPSWNITVMSHPLPEFHPKQEFSTRVFNGIRVLGKYDVSMPLENSIIQHHNSASS